MLRACLVVACMSMPFLSCLFCRTSCLYDCAVESKSASNVWWVFLQLGIMPGASVVVCGVLGVLYVWCVCSYSSGWDGRAREQLLACSCTLVINGGHYDLPLWYQWGFSGRAFTEVLLCLLLGNQVGVSLPCSGFFCDSRTLFLVMTSTCCC